MRLRYLPLVVALPGCFMTADEDLWKQAPDAQTAPDRPGVADLGAVDGPRPEASSDGPAADAPRPDQGEDTAPPDLGESDMACTKLVLKVTTNGDDGEIDGVAGLNVNGEGGTVLMGFWGSLAQPTPTWAFFRFKLDQALPPTATITGAKLELWGYDQQQWSPTAHALEIYAEDAADAPWVTKSSDAPFATGGRQVTKAKVRWPGTGGLSWKLKQYNGSPDLKLLLQELVTSYGGLSKQVHVQLWIRGNQTDQAEVGTHNFLEPGYAAHPHRLTIDWCGEP